jgi:outer membrane protein TolC
VRIHYYRTLGRRELVQIQQEMLKRAEDHVLTVREMYNAGQVTLPQVHQANAALQTQRVARLMAENDYRQSLEKLTALVGVDTLPGPLAGSLEGEACLIDWEEALERLLAESPELQEAHAKLREDEITLRRERREPIKNVFVQGSVGRNFEVDPNQTTAAVQVFMELPIIDRNQGTIRQAQADLSRQAGEVRRTELRLKQDLADQYRRYLTALQHVQNYQAVVLPETRKAYEILLGGYKQERVAWPMVLAGEHKYQDARAVYVHNLIEWREAEVLIRGYLLHGGLLPAPSSTPPGHIDATPRPR